MSTGCSGAPNWARPCSTQVRTWVAEGRDDAAVALAESLRTHEDTRPLGDLASAVVALQRGFPELAWARFSPLARTTWAPYAAEDYTRCGLSQDRDRTVRELRQVIAEEPSIIGLGDWITLSGVAFGSGEHALAGEMFDLAERVAADDPRTGPPPSTAAWSGSRPGCVPRWATRRHAGSARCSPSWTTGTRACPAGRPTSVTTCRASPPWGTSCDTGP